MLSLWQYRALSMGYSKPRQIIQTLMRRPSSKDASAFNTPTTAPPGRADIADEIDHFG
jgi:hypothetical protein